MRFYIFFLINLSIYKAEDEKFILPRFWTNTGFCPWGIVGEKSLIDSLLSDDIKLNIDIISALPNNAVKNIRIHWLLELLNITNIKADELKFNFTKLDNLIHTIMEAKMNIGFELMGNPGGIFNNQKNSTLDLWKEIVFKILQRYIRKYGENSVSKWKFETWNEPDLRTYNKINFTKEKYLQYIEGVRKGISKINKNLKSSSIYLRGPAGLFKNPQKHIFCWSVLKQCVNNLTCPFDVLTFHSKGQGKAIQVLENNKLLLGRIKNVFPNLNSIPIANDEADPIAGWSTPRDFQSDVRYAVTIVLIILYYWNAKLNLKDFQNLESISHDNAFLSYHPYEFHQRTLLACFKMNLTNPPHTQFIQKPVFLALGLMGNLAKYGHNIKIINKNLNITYLITQNKLKNPSFIAIIMVSGNEEQIKSFHKINFNKIMKKLKLNKNNKYSYIIEAIETDTNDPVKIWNFYGSPSYPNKTVRKEMRKIHNPVLLDTNIISKDNYKIKFLLKNPWVILIRICNKIINKPLRPYNLRIKNITNFEIMIIWNEIFSNERCLKTYQVFFLSDNKKIWREITKGYHLPFLSFHYQAEESQEIYGYYKVRSVDVFNRYSNYSETIQYKKMSTDVVF